MQELFPQLFSKAQRAGDVLLQVFSVLEILGYVLIVIFIGATIYCAIALEDIKRRSKEALKNHFIQRAPSRKENPAMERWNQVTHAMTTSDEQQWRSAIIDIDIMLEEVVDAMGVEGETFGEKLKTLGNHVPWIDAAWEVHKLRNILAHEGGRYQLNQREAYRVYKIGEGILYETGYLS